jgi:basic amino acid/polyamine antiporter, APA family
MILAILALDIEAIAKLASAFQLLLFSLLCLAVVIMRESGIDGYDPGYRSRCIRGCRSSACSRPLWLIAEMGRWRLLHARPGRPDHRLVLLLRAQPVDPVRRHLPHVRPPRSSCGTAAWTWSCATSSKEKGLREEDPFDEVVARAAVLDFERSLSLHLDPAASASAWVGRRVRDLDLPVGTLIAVVRRKGHRIVPTGSSVLMQGDRLTIIGDPEGIRQIADRHRPHL